MGCTELCECVHNTGHSYHLPRLAILSVLVSALLLQGSYIYWKNLEKYSTPGKPGKIMEFLQKIMKIMEIS